MRWRRPAPTGSGGSPLLASAPSFPGCGRPAPALEPAANIAPRLCGRLWELRLAGKGKEAAELVAALTTLKYALDLEPEPVGVKYAVSLMTPTFGPELRLPLTPPSPSSASAIRVAIAALAGVHDRALHHLV